MVVNASADGVGQCHCGCLPGSCRHHVTSNYGIEYGFANTLGSAQNNF